MTFTLVWGEAEQSAHGLIESEFPGSKANRQDAQQKLQLAGFYVQTLALVNPKTGVTVAAASILRSDLDRMLIIEYLTVHSLHEKRGLGSKIVVGLKSLAMQEHYRLYVLALLQTVGFWQKQGFSVPVAAYEEEHYLETLYDDCVLLQDSHLREMPTHSARIPISEYRSTGYS